MCMCSASKNKNNRNKSYRKKFSEQLKGASDCVRSSCTKMSHGGAIRYSQYSSGGAAVPQQQPNSNGSGTGSGKSSGHPTKTSGSAAQQQQGAAPHVPSLPLMRPPMLVTSSGASMLPPPPKPQTPPANGGGGGGLPKYPGSPIGSLSGSDTDVSTSNENLSREERYVLSHARVEPQGEENLQGSVTPVNEMQGRFIGDKFSSNTSSDSTRYATPTGGSSSSRSISESRTGGGMMMYANVGTGAGNAGSTGNGPEGVPSNRSSMVGPGSNRNSLKEPNSNRSSMDVSQSSYNTLIIHDDIMYGSVASAGREYASSPPPYMMKKERPRSYGESAASATQVAPMMQDITEITEEYINQSHVLKHLAKEVKLSRGPAAARGHESPARDSGVLSEVNRHGSRQQSSSTSTASTERAEEEKGGKGQKSGSGGGGGRRGSEGGGGGGAPGGNGKLKSKSQPDLTRLYDIDAEEVEAIVKENHLLKQQLNSCYLKVAKSQKLEQEIANIYRVHEELVQSCDRRERLERAARTRLQQDCRRLQELNRAYRDQVEVYQSQLHASSDHQLGRTQQDVLISQLVNQNKSLVDANRRQCIELQAQNATLEEQRIHINVLDTALKRLEEECRQKQVYVERCAQLQHALQSLQNASERREQAERKLRIDYDNDLPNRSGSSTNSETDNLKWQLREKDAQILRLESECAKLEQRNLEESNVRNVAKLAMERNSQETERILAEAKQEKIRYLDEAHAANRKVTELQTRLKLVENRLAEKDAMIRAYQGQKIYGGSTNSYGSYNLSTDSFALNPLGAYNSQTSYVDVSSNSFDVTSNAAGSLLDPSVVVGPYGVGANVAAAAAAAAAAAVSSYASTYGQTPNPCSFVQSSLNLPGGAGGGSSPGGPAYSSPSSSSTSNYSSANFGTGGLVGTGSEHTIYDSKNYDAQRKSIDDQLKQLDEQLLSKVSEVKQHQLNQLARAIAAKRKASAASGAGTGGGSSGLGTASNTSSASSSVDSNGNLLLACAGSSTSAPITNNSIATRQSPASSTSSCSTTNSKSHSQAAAAAGKKHHHHHHAMAKTTSTPAIAVGGKKSAASATTASVGTNTTVSGGNSGRKLAASCKNIPKSATDSSSSSSSGSSSSEPETFY
uniref:Angiomotin_C domain-containing protein n=1 Tax=Anopheles atroparvus TaxID=41427 RepID=A0A182INA1_ANOAO